ncbi:hypothetical protein ORV05_27575 [Amycolatopsis cynarae]|uniref:Uncharacterized protein n=1 Tax=Amycolatopsis cynarae TaxID=2995223 RepID=A0ABY7AY91_9PSEU|nr:hypothetical protein [Amycolatopsis sp. HUAS 11-8]WAL64692.1 hypothetical protein ORV05_27575 [Amycolatopsis sp. HUAS 11-8]
MAKITQMSEEERNRLIDDFWCEVGEELDSPRHGRALADAYTSHVVTSREAQDTPNYRRELADKLANATRAQRYGMLVALINGGDPSIRKHTEWMQWLVEALRTSAGHAQ